MQRDVGQTFEFTIRLIVYLEKLKMTLIVEKALPFAPMISRGRLCGRHYMWLQSNLHLVAQWNEKAAPVY
ncbi:glutathionylspermidine synthase family protein [Anopheles sinensis]|uniref:Glutathionylspermidine synthase family protein n=1 Tax=Anopheles sinensis TaxID=74873 RepID=A0A084WQC4_ANOSI|nr:glutathionylspermidine synthase family protein [Anopheles sinensis]